MNMKFQEELTKQLDDAQTIIFDMDDTLVYTSYANFISYQMAIFETLGVYVPIQEQRFTKTTLKQLFPHLDEELFTEIVQIKKELFAHYMQNTRLNYILSYVIKRYSKEKKLVLSTNSIKGRAISLLKHHNLYEYFDAIFYKENHQQNKYQTIVEELNIDVEKTIIFENEMEQIALAKEVGFLPTNILKI